MAGNAIRFDNSSDRLVRTTGLPDYNSAYTFICWFYGVTLPGNGSQATLFAIDANSGTANYDLFQINGAAGNQTLRSDVDDGAANTTQDGATDLATSTWYCGACVRASNASHSVYLGTLTAALAQEGSTNTRSVSGRSTAATRMESGAYTTSNSDPFSGRVANIKIWTRALTLAELIQEQYQYYPVYADSLHLWTPLIEHTSGLSDQYATDYSGNARNWTQGGTLTSEDGPPLAWVARRRVFLIPAAAGTQYTLDVSGAITPAGAIVWRAGKVLAGGITPAGTLGKAVATSYTGSVTPAGGLVKQPAISMSGAITPTGALVAFKVALLEITGAITPAGALVLQVGKQVAGSITPTGALVKSVGKVAAGALTPAGTLVRGVAAAMAGAIAPTGSLVKHVATSLSGAITPAGALTTVTIPGVVADVARAALTFSRRLVTALTNSARAVTRLTGSGRAATDVTGSDREGQ